MKKLIKGTIITTVAVFALLGASVTALAATGYIDWNGSNAYKSVLITLEQITIRGNELKTERDNSNRSNEQLVNQIKDKENVIKDKENQLATKEQEISAKQKEIDNLKNAAMNNDEQLKQAEKDMKDVDAKAKDALNGLK